MDNLFTKISSVAKQKSGWGVVYRTIGLDILRPSHQTLKRCPSGWGKGPSCSPSLRYCLKHICQNELDNERSFLAKHEAARPTKYLVWQRNGSKNGVPSFDY